MARKRKVEADRPDNQFIVGKSIAVMMCPFGKEGRILAVLIDRDDLERVRSIGYWGISNFSSGSGCWGPYCYSYYRGKQILLHRFLNSTPKGKHTDHKNRRTTDNRKINLRSCSRSVNMANRRAYSNTGIKHIHLRRDGKYVVNDHVRGKTRNFWTRDLEEAKQKAIEWFGGLDVSTNTAVSPESSENGAAYAAGAHA